MQPKAIHTAHVTPATMIINDGAYQPKQMSLFTFDILNRRSPPPKLLDTTAEQTSPHHMLNQVFLWNNLPLDNSSNNLIAMKSGNAKLISLGQTLNCLPANNQKISKLQGKGLSAFHLPNKNLFSFVLVEHPPYDLILLHFRLQ